MFRSLFETHRNAVYWTKVARILHFELGVDANRVRSITPLSLIEICEEARKRNLSVQSAAVACLTALVGTMVKNPATIAEVGLNFLSAEPLLIKWLADGSLHPYCFTQYMNELDALKERIEPKPTESKYIDEDDDEDEDWRTKTV